MAVELTGSMEAQLRDLASKQGRNVGLLIEEAVRTYLEAVAITDLEPADVAETQEALVTSTRTLSRSRPG